MNFLRLILILIVCLLVASYASAQSLPQGPDCPHADGCVVISKAAARAALEAGDKAKALEAENEELRKAIELHKDDKQKLAIEYARTSGELTACKQTAVRDSAIMEILIKNSRKKSIGLIAF